MGGLGCSDEVRAALDRLALGDPGVDPTVEMGHIGDSCGAEQADPDGRAGSASECRIGGRTGLIVGIRQTLRDSTGISAILRASD